MNMRRVIHISGAMLIGLVALVTSVALLAPGVFYDLIEANSDRKMVARCQSRQIATVISDHYRLQRSFPAKTQIANRLVDAQSFRACGMDPVTSRETLQDPWGDEFCLLQRSPSSMVVFSRNNVVGGKTPAAVVNDGARSSEDLETGSRCE